jgi:hypothetical protein
MWTSITTLLLLLIPTGQALHIFPCKLELSTSFQRAPSIKWLYLVYPSLTSKRTRPLEDMRHTAWNIRLATMVMSPGSAVGSRCGQCIHPLFVRIIKYRVLLVAEKFVAADSVANISQRMIPAEPMYIILNLGISESFGKVSHRIQGTVLVAEATQISPDLQFPTTMKIDYVRVYQVNIDRPIFFLG